MHLSLPFYCFLWTIGLDCQSGNLVNPHDLKRFPDYTLVREYNNLHSQTYYAWLNIQIELFPNEPIYTAWKEDSLRLYTIWNLLYQAHNEMLYDPKRTYSLKALRDAIGSEAYERGIMPPPLPIWFYKRLD